MHRAVCFLLVVLPQRLKIRVANRLLGWEIHPTAHLGRSLVLVGRLVMGPHASIGAFNTIRDLDELRMGEGATISSRNLILGIASGSSIYARFPHRDPSLVMGDFSQITTAHRIDVTDRVTLGHHAAIAGFSTSILTHNLNLVSDTFHPGRVEIGDYGVLMSNCTMQANTAVPDRAIVSAGSVIVTKLTAEQTLYRGNPAEPVRALPATLKFFHRQGLQHQIAHELAAWLARE